MFYNILPQTSIMAREQKTANRNKHSFLRIHGLIYRGDKQSKVSKSRFTQQSKLKTKEMSVKKFSCDMCHTKFLRQSYLKKHKDRKICQKGLNTQTTSSVTEEQIKYLKKYTCALCGKRFRNLFSVGF